MLLSSSIASVQAGFMKGEHMENVGSTTGGGVEGHAAPWTVLGGKARAQKLTPDQRSAIARKGAYTRFVATMPDMEVREELVAALCETAELRIALGRARYGK